jgi:hypothetical protein
MGDGCSMRAVETTAAASLDAAAGEELSSALVWPVSRQRNYSGCHRSFFAYSPRG